MMYVRPIVSTPTLATVRIGIPLGFGAGRVIRIDGAME